MLMGKTVVLCVSGGIAAYKSAALTSLLVKAGADVRVVMSENACRFITPVTFETLTGNRVSADTFDRNFIWNVQHVSLAKAAHVFVIAPATANVCAKLAHGIADDMLTSTVLAAECPKIIAPAMNTGMYNNVATQRNFEQLKEDGFLLVDAQSGYLACGDMGKGRMAEPEDILEAVLDAVSPKPLAGLKVLVTAGPTQEALDPVRYITNHSSGRMGYAVARQARRQGAQVTLVSGPTPLEAPSGVKVIPITSARQMADAVKTGLSESDIVIKAAAVGDWRPQTAADNKIKKSDEQMILILEENEDILQWIGENRRPGQVVIGFSMETQNLIENSRRKLVKKGADMIVANTIGVEGAGFQADTNMVTLITERDAIELPKMSKDEVAREILSRALEIRNQ